MTKNDAPLFAASEMVAGMTDAPVSFMFSRRHVTELTALDPSVRAGYIWRKVFLRERKRA